MGSLLGEFADLAIGYDTSFNPLKLIDWKALSWGSLIGKQNLTSEERKLYEILQELQEPYAPGLEDVSPIDIPALLARSKSKYFGAPNEWYRQFHYTADTILRKYNKTVAFKNRYEPRNDEEFISRLLTPHRAYVVKLMMLTRATFLPNEVNDTTVSVFRTVFGDPVSKFSKRPTNNYPYWRYTSSFKRDPLYVYERGFGHFRPNLTLLPTDNGLCGVYNANPNAVYNKSTATGDFFDTVWKMNKGVNATVDKIPAAGLSYAFAALLAGPQNLLVQDEGERSRQFKITLNQHEDYVNNLYESIELQPGFKTIVTVEPTQHVTSEAFKVVVALFG